eukprot:TRINITY_DN32339_c0_g1_i1.p1 TRINITY_DN32339_c0_g1~~TRINITY_DN32339_c0_g1_i1.p1  ORF type:complete len:367 (-),score=164.80 TRINITY_DN32339_c0_g1_i1:177-1277(-)
MLALATTRRRLGHVTGHVTRCIRRRVVLNRRRLATSAEAQTPSSSAPTKTASLAPTSSQGAWSTVARFGAVGGVGIGAGLIGWHLMRGALLSEQEKAAAVFGELRKEHGAGFDVHRLSENIAYIMQTYPRGMTREQVAAELGLEDKPDAVDVLFRAMRPSTAREREAKENEGKQEVPGKDAVPVGSSLGLHGDEDEPTVDLAAWTVVVSGFYDDSNAKQRFSAIFGIADSRMKGRLAFDRIHHVVAVLHDLGQLNDAVLYTNTRGRRLTTKEVTRKVFDLCMEEYDGVIEREEFVSAMLTLMDESLQDEQMRKRAIKVTPPTLDELQTFGRGLLPSGSPSNQAVDAAGAAEGGVNSNESSSNNDAR